MFDITLILSAFVAGLLMFLAPCTLPLVPAYLAFIAGVKPNTVIDHKTKIKIIRNSIYYCLGFSVVFILLGILAGLAGTFVGSLRHILLPLSGVLIIIFGFQMLHVLKPAKLFSDFHIILPDFIKPGRPTSAVVIGMAFALGWTPCVGPILATILLLAGTSGTVIQGALLLTVFSIGLAIPFILTATIYTFATQHILKHQLFIRYSEVFGGVFLILIGVLLLTNNFDLTILYGYKIFNFFGIGDLLDYY